ncbi:MAG: hypothetical protein ACI82G_001799 [Bradymonadia bacterium]|jgi:hypothetical protein
MGEGVDQDRLYPFVGVLIGMTAGVFVHGYFNLSREWLLAWLAVAGLIGMVVGRLLLAVQRQSQAGGRDGSRAPTTEALDVVESTEATAAETAPPKKRPSGLLSGLHSSSSLKTMRVNAITSKLAPPELELHVLVDDVSHVVRVAVVAGVLGKLTPLELKQRAEVEAIAKAPKSAKGLRFVMVSYGSEGPVERSGACVLGWTFRFVDGRLGLQCDVTTSGDGFTLCYDSTSTFIEPGPGEAWVEPGPLMDAARAAIDSWVGTPLWLRVEVPNEALVYTPDPLSIADVDADTLRVRNLEGLRERLHESVVGGERFSLEQVVGWWRGGEADGELATVLSSGRFAAELRAMAPAAVARVAAGILRQEGPASAAAIREHILAEDLPELQREWLALLAALPSGLAIVELQALHGALEDSALRGESERLIASRRAGELGVNSGGPLGQLDLLELREAMGRGDIETIAMRSTYDADADLIAPIVKRDVRVHQVRRLSGDANLLVSAHFVSTTADRDLVLSSTPLPVPCQLLHIVGEDAARAAARYRASPLAYTAPEILQDISSGSVPKVHRAALYIAALGMPVPGLLEKVQRLLHRRGLDAAFRRAVVCALAAQDDADAEAAVRSIALAELPGVSEFARGLIAERDAAATPPLAVAGGVASSPREDA